MSSWKYERKKMFLLHKGYLFIGLYIALSLASLIVYDKPANPDTEMNATTYSFYLDQVKGPDSDKTKQFLASEAAKISSAKVALQRASDDYYDGNMAEKDYLAVSGPLENLLEREQGFKLVYDQYTYIRENPVNRYFLSTNGWGGLLSNDSLDLLWVLLLLLLVAPVFGFEFDSKMDTLLLTVKKGTRHHAVCKIGLVFLTVIVLSLLTAGLRYGFYQFKYGLDNGSYPLQSLSFFGTSTKGSSLLEAFLWITAGKLFGSLCFAMLILFVSVMLKKYAVTLFSCTALILLPYYGMSLQSTKYFIPGPLGFMVSTGFFRGNERRSNPFKDRMDVVFREVSLTAWIIVFAVTLSLGILMFVLIMIRRTNAWSRSTRKRIRPRKAFYFLFTLVISVTMLSACTSTGSPKTNDIYNYSSMHSFQNERYHFYAEDTGQQGSRILMEEKQTGVKHHFPRNPMPSLTRVENAIYGNGKHVYYLQYDSDKSGVVEQVTRLSVIDVDTTTFQERIVFETRLGTDKTMILGLVGANHYDAKFYLTISSFFLDEHSLYFIGQNEIRRVDRLTGRMKVILRLPGSVQVAYDGRTIYYVNDKSEVVKYDTRTDSKALIPDLITRFFVLTDTELFFLNRKDQQRIYAMNLHDSSVRRITDKSVLEFTCEESSIVYVNKSDLKKYRIDQDGKNDRLYD